MGLNVSLTALRVLRVFLDAPSEPQYGLGLSRATGIKAGSLYPILSRFESANWIAGEWEDIDEAVEGRRRRRFYTLTEAGEAAARQLLAHATDQLTPTSKAAKRALSPGLEPS
jgi:DNA-binding PadR family transcriptional regulator